MIILYSYPELFGVADNNGYGLKVFAFLRLNGMPFKHEHIFDASAAPRGQLPYIVDYHRPRHRQEPLEDRRRPNRGAARHEPSDHPDARRSLLGDVVLALEG